MKILIAILQVILAILNPFHMKQGGWSPSEQHKQEAKEWDELYGKEEQD